MIIGWVVLFMILVTKKVGREMFISWYYLYWIPCSQAEQYWLSQKCQTEM